MKCWSKRRMKVMIAHAKENMPRCLTFCRLKIKEEMRFIFFIIFQTEKKIKREREGKVLCAKV